MLETEFDNPFPVVSSEVTGSVFTGDNCILEHRSLLYFLIVQSLQVNLTAFRCSSPHCALPRGEASSMCCNKGS